MESMMMEFSKMNSRNARRWWTCFKTLIRPHKIIASGSLSGDAWRRGGGK